MIIVGIVFMLPTVPAVVLGLRQGRVHLRSRGNAYRRRQPGTFWASIVITSLAAAFGAGMLLFGLARALA
jgi:hypothetical protein